MDEDEILQMLKKKALGFVSDEIVEEYCQDKNGEQVLCKRKVTKKVNPPDFSALKFLLERGELDDDISKMTDEQLLREKERLLQLLKEKENKK